MESSRKIEVASNPAGNRTGSESENYSRFLNNKIFGSLDGLRAIAIIAVLWHHHSNNTVPGWKFTTRGFLGVDLFFIISGFLIVTLLLREQRRTGTLSLPDFYARRFLRILPPYYLALLIVGIVAVYKHGAPTSEAVRHDFPYAMLFLSNFVPMQSLLAITWSLSVEEQFYLIVPTMEKHARRALPYLLPLAYLVVSLPALGFFSSVSLPTFFRETTFGPILLGVTLAHALNTPRGFEWVWRLVSWRPAPLIALGLALAAASYPGPEFTGWPRLLAHWALLALVASCVVRETNILAPLLSLWPTRRIGAVSYGIYLYHLMVMHFVINGFEAAGLAQGHAIFVGTALTSWLLAEISYRLFETRFLNLRTRFTPATAKSAGAVNLYRSEALKSVDQ